MSKPPSPPRDRFFAKVRVDEQGCWIWTAARNPAGYGKFSIGHQRWEFAHRWSYMEFVGPLDGDTVDHLCGVTSCACPDHLERVTNAENLRRAARVPTHCPQGHPYNDTIKWRGARVCYPCKAERESAKRARQRDESPTCPSGHPWSIAASGMRFCGPCRSQRASERWARR